MSEPIPNTQYPISNPQSPIPNIQSPIPNTTDALIAALVAEPDTETFKLVTLYGQSARRLGRLYYLATKPPGDVADELEAATRQALAALSEEWGVELL